MKIRMLFLIVGCLFLLGCPADKDESGIQNGMDFKDYAVTVSGDSISTDIDFYGNLALGEFFYYFDTGGDSTADFVVKCRRSEFAVYRNGKFDDARYRGVPKVKGSHYSLEFPLGVLELDRKRKSNIFYWFFSIAGGDRMPDSGRKLLALVFK